MIKISSTYTKKVRGSEEYSSCGYHVTIETEAPNDAVQDPQGLRKRIHSMFDEARQIVNVEIQKDRAGPQSNSQPQEHHHTRPTPRFGGNGQNNNEASPKQLQYLLSLASRGHGMDVDALSAYAEKETGIGDLGALSKSQASQLIEVLK